MTVQTTYPDFVELNIKTTLMHLLSELDILFPFIPRSYFKNITFDNELKLAPDKYLKKLNPLNDSIFIFDFLKFVRIHHFYLSEILHQKNIFLEMQRLIKTIRLMQFGNVTDISLVCQQFAIQPNIPPVVSELSHPTLVLAAIDAGNLELVAVAARRRWPSAEIIIAGDDDRLTPNNPGATKARVAAIAAFAMFALPEWPTFAPVTLTDFNDLASG